MIARSGVFVSGFVLLMTGPMGGCCATEKSAGPEGATVGAEAFQYTVETKVNGQKLHYVISPTGADCECFTYPKTNWSDQTPASDHVQWGQWTHPKGSVKATIFAKPDEAGDEVIPRRWPPVRTKRTNVMAGRAGQELAEISFTVTTIRADDPTDAVEVALEKITCQSGTILLQNPADLNLSLQLVRGESGWVYGRFVGGRVVLRYAGIQP